MATRESRRSQHALQAKNMHNKDIYGHNHTGRIARGKYILLLGKWKCKFGGLVGEWN